jgi:hypothetical protein
MPKIKRVELVRKLRLTIRRLLFNDCKQQLEAILECEQFLKFHVSTRKFAEHQDDVISNNFALFVQQFHNPASSHWVIYDGILYLTSAMSKQRGQELNGIPEND